MWAKYICTRARRTQIVRERERDVGIICGKIDDGLALKAWTQRRERKSEERGGYI